MTDNSQIIILLQECLLVGQAHLQLLPSQIWKLDTWAITTGYSNVLHNNRAIGWIRDELSHGWGHESPNCSLDIMCNYTFFTKGCIQATGISKSQ